ncbi:allophanate hydrolase family protein [Roseobacter sp. SK209-2-6]|uniref:5-oxoprolinase subunit B family protein n=1 Tax=Roseobacter sp. SK209-2-6 TaxID=388739 RepID=UPI0000F3C215|nr:carboxyltransferase domain-containing protein [Roseobacter sp. SK209-2-6]EBA15326.1 allophanate hydrolase family protein [Roseobacter sp. SK209-2-6]
MALSPDWPRISALGFDGFLVSFGEHLTEAANRAALAFRDALERESWPSARESSASLVSAYLRFDPLRQGHAEIRALLQDLLARQDWYQAPLPRGRRLWHVPAVFGDTAAPQLGEAAAAAGFTPQEAIASLTERPVRIQTIGFAPGQPYLGELAPEWDIPRQTELTRQIPAGALAVAIRQLVLFPMPTPTGWRHVAQTAFQLFRPLGQDPFLLRPGDEIRFEPLEEQALPRLQQDPDGGARFEVIR